MILFFFYRFVLFLPSIRKYNKGLAQRKCRISLSHISFLKAFLVLNGRRCGSASHTRVDSARRQKHECGAQTPLSLRPQFNPRVAGSANFWRDRCANHPVATKTPLHAAKIAERAKDAAWKTWSEQQNKAWAPLAMESTGAMSERMVKWLRERCAENDGALTVTTAFDAIVCAIQTEVLEGAHNLFASARGEKIRQPDAVTSRIGARPAAAAEPTTNPPGISSLSLTPFHPSNNPFFRPSYDAPVFHQIEATTSE